MKKTLFAFFAAIPFLYGCASAPLALNEYSPVAIVTVYSNPSVPWYDEKTNSESVEDGVLSGAVNRFLNKKNPEHETAQERIDRASELLSQRMKDFGLEVVDPSVSSEFSAYKNAGKGFTDYLGNTVPAKGYEAITSSNGKRNRTLCRESGAKSVIYVKFHYQKVMVKDGVHNIGVAPRLVLTIFGTDENGKMLINKEYSEVSSEYAELVKSSNWDKDKVVSLYPDLESKVINRFLVDYVLSGDEAAATGIAPTAIKINRPVSENKATEENDAKNEGLEDAILQEKRVTAKKLLEKGMTAKEAGEITGLSEAEIESLK